MDLALHLGSPAGVLARTMTEAEFGDWQSYASTRMLPWRRVEMYLAQIALLIARTMGGHEGNDIRAFMFDAADEPQESAEDQAAAAREFFGFSPINEG